MTRKSIALLMLLMGLLALLLAGCGSRKGAAATATPTKTPAGATGAVVEQATPIPAGVPAPMTTQPAAETVAQPVPSPQSVTRGRVTASLLNIRAEPSTTATIAREASEGEAFDIVGRSQDGLWLQLASNGILLGWASTEFLEIFSEAIAAAPAPAAPQGEQPAAPAPTAAPVSPGTFLPASMSSPDYGAQAFLWWRSEIADRDLQLLREGGFNWVKQSFAWETIEGAGNGVYDWSVADRVVTHVNSSGLKLLARMSIDPDKANFWAGTPPGNTAAFAAYVGTVAQRYNCAPGAVGCIQAFQIWNEPNLAREWGNKRPNPAEYAAFLGAAYRAIKAVHPTAIVISAGMAPTGDDSDIAMPDDKFYDLMYQAMGGNSDGYFDMLGVHGAGYAAPPEMDPAEVASTPKYGGYRFFAFRHVEDIRAIMVRNGDSDKRMVLLEFGWTYDKVNPSYKWHGADAGIDEFVQADYLKRAYIYAAANWQPWIALMNLLTMPNLDWLEDGNPQDEEQYWWAIMEPSPIDQKYWRPAYIVLCDYLMEDVKGGVCIYKPQ